MAISSRATKATAAKTTAAKAPAKVKLRTFDDLTPEEKVIMDRAVRVARRSYWCDRFDEAAPEIFGVPKTDVVDSDGFSCRGFNRKGFNDKGFNREGFNEAGFNEAGYNKDGFNEDGFNIQGYNKDGVDKDGRDKYRYDSNGWTQDGYNRYGERRADTRAWYARQAAKPETDFRYDERGYERPDPKAAKKTATVPRSRTSTSRLIGGGF